jgi:quercetin dioxygenase-like cupin family protein
MTRRDVFVALIAVVLTLAGVSAVSARGPVMGSRVFDWNSLTPTPNKTGAVRRVVQEPTATLDELEIHVTTLNPGQISHPPHKHPNEELVILDSGKLEATSNGKTRVLGPGSIIFNASNQLHGVRNVGDVPATYHVINWTSPGAKAAPPKP